MHYIYRITNVLSNKVYIGQTINEKRRWQAHKSYAKNPERTGQYIHRAMKKYGTENFVYEVIATCRTQEEADESEMLLIKRYDSRNPTMGYNLAPGGDAAWNAGLPSELQPMYGKKQSEHFKQRMSEVHGGKIAPHTEQWKIDMSKKMTGREITWADKISDSQSGDKGPNARLTWEIVNQLRKDYQEGLTQKQLSQKYDLGTGHVCNIVNNKQWKIR
jgi:group I intron endonuclease